MSLGSEHLGEDSLTLGSGLIYMVQFQGFGLMSLGSGLNHLG